MCAERNRTLSQLGTEKIAFTPKSLIRTDGLTDIRTGISNCRVASLLMKRKDVKVIFSIESLEPTI